MIDFSVCDEEMFEDNPDEYIRRDIEGSDVGTRRKAACDLIKVLAKFLEPEIKVVFLTYVQVRKSSLKYSYFYDFHQLVLSPQNMLQTYATSRRNWKSKNAAIYLVTSLESRGQTQRYGVTQISNIVNLGEFAIEHIVSELQTSQGEVRLYRLCLLLDYCSYQFILHFS